MKETPLQLLKNHIRIFYKSQEQFAKTIGLTRAGLNYIIKTSKENNGRLKTDFIKRLERYSINIPTVVSTATNDFMGGINEPNGPYTSLNIESLDKDIKNLERQVIEKEKQIALLEKVNAMLEAENTKLKEAPVVSVGKTGGRRTS